MKYLAHGLRIESTIPLHAVENRHENAECEIAISVTNDVATTPEQDPILSHVFDNGQTVRAVRADDGTTLISVSDVATFRLSAELDRIDVQPLNPESLGLAAILTEGWIMSTLLMLRGISVFHATAVEHDSRCIALLADSGRGKSTTAAMLVRDGAELMSDDVLRIERGATGFHAFPGVTALRLRRRKKMRALLTPLEQAGASLARTNDGRTSVGWKRTSAEPVALAAVLLPIIQRDITEARVEWLDPVRATVELNRYPRVFDWHIDEPVRRHFSLSADVATEIPVGLFYVPWGKPWSARLIDTAFSA